MSSHCPSVLIREHGDGSVWIITINRPDSRNAVDRETASSLAAAFIKFEEDSKARVAILHGSGGNFCAGADLKALSNGIEKGLNSNQLVPVVSDTHMKARGPVFDNTGPMGPSRLLLSKPVIAAISGFAVAGGLELACWCDLRVCDTTAIFGVYCRRFGVPLIDGGTYRLPQLIGLSRAMDMILTGRPVTAQEAYQFGLANRLVTVSQSPHPEGINSKKLDDDSQSSSSNTTSSTSSDSYSPVLQEAIKLASEISQFPQLCMREDRLSVYSGLGEDWRTAIKKEFENGANIVHQEGFFGAQSFSKGSGRHGKSLHSKL